MKLRLVFAALIAAVKAIPLEARDIPDYPGLYFSEGKFEITMFSDLHVGDIGKQDEIQKGPQADDQTIEVIRKVLNKEPTTHLAVLNGDLLSCEWVAEKDTSKLLDKIMRPFLDRKLPFATTFGNHDWSPTCHTGRMWKYIWNTANPKDTPGLTFTTSSVDGDINLVGTTNYYIPLYTTVNGEKLLKMILWFFDSKGGYGYTGKTEEKVPVYGYVHPDVLSWFKNVREQLEKQHGGKTIPSLVFVHIPIVITDIFGRPGFRDPATMPGIQYRELISYQDDTKGIPFMQALVDTDGVLGVFSGHDHSTDWCVKWRQTPKPVPTGWPPAARGNGLNVCFGRHTGYGGYSEIMRGARHIVIYEDALGGDNAIETWNRLENGEVSGRVMLNSTYGTDRYPAAVAKFSDGKLAPQHVIGRSNVEKMSSVTSNAVTSEGAKTKFTSKATKSGSLSKTPKTASTKKTNSVKTTTPARVAATLAKFKAGD